MQRPTLLAAAALCSTFALGTLPSFARAADVEIKLGTLAPKGSTWDVLIKEMAEEWSKASDGKVKLRVFPGGVLGNEGDMVRKMRVGQLSAAALTVVGLHDITPEPEAISAPMVVESYEELDFVMSKMTPQLEKKLEEKGYVVLAWSEVGEVHFFSTRALHTPEQAKEAKLFAWEGDPASVDAWKAAGLRPVVLSATDIVPSLQTGMIDTVATAPLYALTARMYQKADHMMEMSWAIVIGATVVKKELWEKVPADKQQRLLEISRAYGRRIALEVRKMNGEAIAKMKSQGLKVEKTEDLAGWRAAAERANQIVRGKVVPAAVFDEVLKYRNEYRAQHKK